MIILAFFIFRPYGTLEIIGNGVAINILSLAGHFSGFLPTIYYKESKTIFKTLLKQVRASSKTPLPFSYHSPPPRPSPKGRGGNFEQFFLSKSKHNKKPCARQHP
jgi:hypothetical protein